MFSLLPALYQEVISLRFDVSQRISRQKLKSSQDFALERGYSPIFEHVLVPRSKGLHATLDALQDSVDAVIDVTLGYAYGDQDVSWPRRKVQVLYDAKVH